MSDDLNAASLSGLILEVRQDDQVRYAPLRWSGRAHALADRAEQMLIDLQTCLHLLGEDGYIGDPDYPEVDAILARYEKAVEA